MTPNGVTFFFSVSPGWVLRDVGISETMWPKQPGESVEQEDGRPPAIRPCCSCCANQQAESRLSQQYDGIIGIQFD